MTVVGARSSVTYATFMPTQWIGGTKMTTAHQRNLFTARIRRNAVMAVVFTLLAIAVG